MQFVFRLQLELNPCGVPGVKLPDPSKHEPGEVEDPAAACAWYRENYRKLALPHKLARLREEKDAMHPGRTMEKKKTVEVFNEEVGEPLPGRKSGKRKHKRIKGPFDPSPTWPGVFAGHGVQGPAPVFVAGGISNGPPNKKKRDMFGYRWRAV